MIEFIFTIDYEIYGNGEGSLSQHIHQPMERLRTVFQKWKAPLVVFVEAAELEIIERTGEDETSGLIRRQLRDCYEQGFEVALHIHPQWYNASRENGRWRLDYRDYNLCLLTKPRIREIVNRAVEYLGTSVGVSGFVPFSFRAGNWLFQPSDTAAQVLIEKGIKVDSSVFKGGLQRRVGLDYRASLKNGFFWEFDRDANRAVAGGPLVEIPTYSVMTPFWNMVTSKRVGMQRRGASTTETTPQKLTRLLDYVRPRYPLKFDFCRMTTKELRSIMDRAVQEEARDSSTYKPIVAIGHTKDLLDTEGIEYCLSYLSDKRIPVVTFPAAYENCKRTA